jgi:rod shape determining protein RodA
LALVYGTRTGPSRRTPAWRAVLSQYDPLLASTSLMVLVLGILMVFSATRGQLIIAHVSQYYYLERQILWAFIGLTVMALFAWIDYHRLEAFGIAAYIGAFLALLLVMSPIGSSALGSQRWFQLGPLQLQPSEMAIAATMLAMAIMLSRLGGEMNLRQLAVMLAVAGVPALLVIVQPDLGSGIIILVVAGLMITIAGIRRSHLIGLVVLGAAGVVAVIHLGLLHGYQLQRLTGFLHQGKIAPGVHYSASQYNLAQSKIAIGSGRLFGQGLFHGSQTNLAYVPEQSTDFIFTAVAEQLGFVGGAFLLCLYSIMVWRVWVAARDAHDLLGRLLCTGVLALLVISIFENVGMTMGIMPITGIPLPFVSYGGSALVLFALSIGIVLNVSRKRVR